MGNNKAVFKKRQAVEIGRDLVQRLMHGKIDGKDEILLACMLKDDSDNHILLDYLKDTKRLITDLIKAIETNE